MEIKTLNAGLSVSAQITASDIQAIKDAGFRTIICNRPDGEGEDQPSFNEIAQAANKLRLNSVYQPIVAGQICDADGVKFATHLATLPGPVLAYCRTGARSSMLCAIAQEKQNGKTEVPAF